MGPNSPSLRTDFVHGEVLRCSAGRGHRIAAWRTIRSSNLSRECFKYFFVSRNHQRGNTTESLQSQPPLLLFARILLSWLHPYVVLRIPHQTRWRKNADSSTPASASAINASSLHRLGESSRKGTRHAHSGPVEPSLGRQRPLLGPTHVRTCTTWRAPLLVVHPPCNYDSLKKYDA